MNPTEKQEIVMPRNYKFSGFVVNFHLIHYTKRKRISRKDDTGENKTFWCRRMDE